MTLAIHIDGPDDAPALVMLHAIATSAALWAPQRGVLANRFRLVTLDLPGHGGSALLGLNATYADYADAVVATLDAHAIDSFALAGLSFGAMVSMQVAARHSGRVRGVVLANCAAKTPPPVAAMWRDRVGAVEAGGMESQVERTLERWFTPGFVAASPLTLEWVRGMILATNPAGFIAAARMIEGLDHLALLGDIDCPALVLAGAEDQATPPAALAAIASAMPAARLVTLDAAHLANVEAPVAFAEAVGSFAAAL